MINLRNKLKCPFCYAYYVPQRTIRQRCPDCDRECEPIPVMAGAMFRLQGRRYRIGAAVNHPVAPGKYGFAHESFRHPDLGMLRKKYRLEELVRPYREEFQRQLVLRDWICAAWTSGQPSVRAPVPTPDPDYHVKRMLVKARTAGHTYFCTYKALAAVQLAPALGWTARLVNIDGTRSPSGDRTSTPHMVYEIWSNQFNKWYFSDALFNHHYEKGATPLSVHEIRREYFKNLGKDITLKWGTGRFPLPPEIHGGISPWSFEWYVIYLHNNFFDFPPGDHIHPLLLCRDRFNRRDVWRRWRASRGRGNVYVSKGMVLEEGSQHHLNCAINQTEILLFLRDDRLIARFHHNMPNFGCIAFNADGGWKRFTDPRNSEYRWKMGKGKAILQARAVNTRGVAGPMSLVAVEPAKR